MEISVRMGAFAPPIHEQLGDDENAVAWGQEQALADAITMLAVHGLLADGESKRARERLFKRKILPRLRDASEITASHDLDPEGGV